MDFYKIQSYIFIQKAQQTSAFPFFSKKETYNFTKMSFNPLVKRCNLKHSITKTLGHE